MKKSVFLFLIFINLFVFSQNAIQLKAKVSCDSLPIENIHVYNQNSKKGTTTNKNGVFIIEVSLNDVLLISGIQYNSIKIKITSRTLKSKKIEIVLKQKINELEIVSIKNHNLTGSLLMDNKNVPENYKKNITYKLALKGIKLNAPGKTDKAENIKVKDPLINSETVQSINLIGIYKILTSKIKNKRKIKKAKKERIKKLPILIRHKLGDVFFTEKLNIPKLLIEDFILFTKEKGSYLLFNQNKIVELMDLFFLEKKLYLKTKF